MVSIEQRVVRCEFRPPLRVSLGEITEFLCQLAEATSWFVVHTPCPGILRRAPELNRERAFLPPPDCSGALAKVAHGADDRIVDDLRAARTPWGCTDVAREIHRPRHLAEGAMRLKKALLLRVLEARVLPAEEKLGVRPIHRHDEIREDVV
jgi:hypothetical protein